MHVCRFICSKLQLWWSCQSLRFSQLVSLLCQFLFHLLQFADHYISLLYALVHCLPFVLIFIDLLILLFESFPHVIKTLVHRPDFSFHFFLCSVKVFAVFGGDLFDFFIIFFSLIDKFDKLLFLSLLLFKQGLFGDDGLIECFNSF